MSCAGRRRQLFLRGKNYFCRCSVQKLGFWGSPAVCWSLSVFFCRERQYATRSFCCDLKKKKKSWFSQPVSRPEQPVVAIDTLPTNWRMYICIFGSYHLQRIVVRSNCFGGGGARDVLGFLLGVGRFLWMRWGRLSSYGAAPRGSWRCVSWMVMYVYVYVCVWTSRVLPDPFFCTLERLQIWGSRRSTTVAPMLLFYSSPVHTVGW